MENLRIVDDIAEIYDFFQDAIAIRANVMLWQNIDGKRTIYKARFSKANLSTNKLSLQIENQKHLGMNERATLYIRSSHKSILFKTKILKRNRNGITLNMPAEVRAHEYRSSPRAVFKESSDRTIMFEKYSLYQSSVTLYEENLLDLSEKGLAFVTTFKTVSQVQPGDSITILQIGNMSFSPRLEGVVVYSRAKTIQHSNHVMTSYRVGVQFEQSIPRAVINQVSS